MKTSVLIFFILSILSGAFGYWGIFTNSGSRYFDEMDGMIPWGFLLLAGVLLTVAVIFLIISYIKRR